MDEGETLDVTDVTGMFEMIRSKLAKYDRIGNSLKMNEGNWGNKKPYRVRSRRDSRA